MRIQVRLSQETENILSFEKEKYEKMEGVCTTYGYIVNKIAHKMLNNCDKKIDWKKVKETSLSHLQSESKKIERDYSTTLNLESTVVDSITNLQIEFKKIFDAVRVHRAYAIRMLVRAYVLSEQNIDIYAYEEDINGKQF